ncbi:MAG: SprB repeat-containing protein [Flavobacteriales bacterium]|nr:SprB repeat-containing protein [Flavobacteriales bacterium]
MPAPPPITVVSTMTDPSCNGDCNGSIALQVSGGNGLFTYLWSPIVTGQGTPNATALCAGNYQVTITSGACDTTLVFDLTAPPPITATATLTPPTCASECDGSIILDVNGGTPGYSYVWTPPVNGQGTPNATQLCAGSYSVLITDLVGCDTTLTFQLDDPPAITVDITTTPASCGGLCDGTATAVVTGGVGLIDYNWQGSPTGGQGTPNATGFCPGAYTLTVTDANGCQVITPFTISTPSGIDASGVVTPASCGNTCDGAIDVTVSGGVPGYIYLWTPDVTGQGTPNASNLCPGNYALQITDAAQCDTVLLFVVDAPLAIIPNPSQTDETCNGPCDGTATVNPTGGDGLFAYFWDPPPPGGGQGTNTATGLCPGLWSVTITDGSAATPPWCSTYCRKCRCNGSLGYRCHVRQPLRWHRDRDTRWRIRRVHHRLEPRSSRRAARQCDHHGVVHRPMASNGHGSRRMLRNGFCFRECARRSMPILVISGSCAGSMHWKGVGCANGRHGCDQRAVAAGAVKPPRR